MAKGGTFANCFASSAFELVTERAERAHSYSSASRHGYSSFNMLAGHLAVKTRSAIAISAFYLLVCVSMTVLVSSPLPVLAQVGAALAAGAFSLVRDEEFAK